MYCMERAMARRAGIVADWSSSMLDAYICWELCRVESCMLSLSLSEL